MKWGMRMMPYLSYRKALELNGESDATLYNIGIYYRDKGRYDEAIEYYLRAMSIKPDKTSALGHLVGIYFSRKEYAKGPGICRESILSLKRTAST